MITLKLFRLSWISALSPPVLFRLVAFFFFTQGEVALVKIKINTAGTRAARPKAEIDGQQKNTGTGHGCECTDELHQRLAEKLVDFIGVVVDP